MTNIYNLTVMCNCSRVGASTRTQYLGTSTSTIKYVQVQVQSFAECTWVLPKYIANALGYNYQVPSTNVLDYINSQCELSKLFIHCIFMY